MNSFTIKALIFSSVALLIFVGCTNPFQKNEGEQVQQKEEEKVVEVDNEQEARDALVNFFNQAHEGYYEEAWERFDPDKKDYELMESMSAPEERSDKVRVLQNFCEKLETCLEVRIVNSRKVSSDEYIFDIQFINDDGSIYVLGPCCAETEETMPSEDQFAYQVKKKDGQFKVISTPLYHP
ncbi:hypothetical protein KKH43_03310 [Patescibacteria group bacterium]|nr:hypothetical protein [Patescibacteria group bacterium]